MKKLVLIKAYCITFLLLTNLAKSQTPQKQKVDGAVSSTVSGTSTQGTATVSSTPNKKRKLFKRRNKTSTNPSSNDAKLDSIKAVKNKEKGAK